MARESGGSGGVKMRVRDIGNNMRASAQHMGSEIKDEVCSLAFSGFVAPALSVDEDSG